MNMKWAVSSSTVAPLLGAAMPPPAARAQVVLVATGATINSNFISTGLKGPARLLLQPVVEPGSVALGGLGVLALIASARRRRPSAAPTVQNRPDRGQSATAVPWWKPP
jgi:hypothetical protein